jgi:hypothetical protein
VKTWSRRKLFFMGMFWGGVTFCLLGLAIGAFMLWAGATR